MRLKGISKKKTPKKRGGGVSLLFPFFYLVLKISNKELDFNQASAL
ncbi:hypothetical protein OUG_1384 [Helicobacter pylori R32b]|nr:hypothetical protein OUG_1384 [Helicobacter pylori R32b]